MTFVPSNYFMGSLKTNFNEGVIDYATDREKVLRADMMRPPNQNVGLISFLQDDPTCIRLHGCFPDNESAKRYMADLVEMHRLEGLPIPQFTAVVDVGKWKPWPPRKEYVDDYTLCDETLDKALHSFFKHRKESRKNLVQRALDSANPSDTQAIQKLEAELEELAKV